MIDMALDKYRKLSHPHECIKSIRIKLWHLLYDSIAAGQIPAHACYTLKFNTFWIKFEQYNAEYWQDLRSFGTKEMSKYQKFHICKQVGHSSKMATLRQLIIWCHWILEMLDESGTWKNLPPNENPPLKHEWICTCGKVASISAWNDTLVCFWLTQFLGRSFVSVSASYCIPQCVRLIAGVCTHYVVYNLHYNLS